MIACCLMMTETGWAQQRPQKNRDRTTPKKLIEQIVGTWQLEATVDKSKKKAVPQKDTIGMAWLEFRPDGRYKSGSNGQGGSIQLIDSGSYRLNEEHSFLYLQSDLTQSDVSHAPSEWALTLKGNAMTLRGHGSEHAERFLFTYQKTKEGLSTNQ